MNDQAARLLAELKRHDVDCDIAQRLQIERLLAVAGESRTRAELKTLVTPILARSEEEQRRLHEIFDGKPAPARRGGRTRTGPGRVGPERRRTRRWALAAACAVPVVAVGAWVAARTFYERPVAGAPAPDSPAAGTAPGTVPPVTDSAAPAPTPGVSPAPPAADTLPVIRPKPVPEPGSSRGRRASGRGLLLVPGLLLFLFALYELLRFL